MTTTRKHRVLIVDDEPSARQTAEALLLPEGYDLASAASGQECLTLLASSAVDLILLDVMMPGMDGFEVCSRLKANDAWRHIPIILVTALDNRETLVRGLDAGADDFLAKPVNGLELRARTRSMLRIKSQYDALEEMLAVREKMANLIVHDARAPLTVIAGHSDSLKQSIADPTMSHGLQQIFDQAMRLEGFLNDLLMVAKSRHDELTLNRAPVDVRRLVANVGESYSAAISKRRKITYSADLPAEPRHVSLDHALFHRLLDNLLINAFKFSPSGGTVTVRLEYLETDAGTEAPSPGLRLQVVDEGPGIPEEHRERIFDQFEVVAMKEAGASQHGLGLALCKLVAEAHGGSITVTGNQRSGTIFTVEI